MFQYSWSGNGSFFCYMPYNEYGNTISFCNPKKYTRGFSHLRNTSRSRRYLFLIHGLDRIYDHNLGFFLCNLIFNIRKSCFTQQTQGI